MKFFLTARSFVIQNYGSGSRRPLVDQELGFFFLFGNLLLSIFSFLTLSAPKSVQKVYRNIIFSSNNSFIVKSILFGSFLP
jgi:hypothetical protein